VPANLKPPDQPQGVNAQLTSKLTIHLIRGDNKSGELFLNIKPTAVDRRKGVGNCTHRITPWRGLKGCSTSFSWIMHNHKSQNKQKQLSRIAPGCCFFILIFVLFFFYSRFLLWLYDWQAIELLARKPARQFKAKWWRHAPKR